VEQRPIIIKRIKKAAHAHHGGSWKVAYADFVTAMMAFFLLMWLMGFSTEGERKAIADFFANPSAIQGKGGSSTSLIDLSKGMDSPRSNEKVPNQETTSVNVKDVADESAAKAVAASTAEAKLVETEKDKKRLESLLDELKKAVDASQALQPFKDQLLLDITPEGLRLQIVDKENRPMFDIGSANLQSYTRVILHEVSKLIAVVPNHISISGHTDARAYSSGAEFSNWELSADRANACRRELVRAGLGEEKIARVVGVASTALFDKANPLSPINRRISIIVMNKETEDAMLLREKNEKHIASDEPVTTGTIQAAPVVEPTPTPVLVIEPTPAPAKKIVPTATPVPAKAVAPTAKPKSKVTATPVLQPSAPSTLKLPTIPSAVQLPGLPINKPATGAIAPAISLPSKTAPSEQNKSNP